MRKDVKPRRRSDSQRRQAQAAHTRRDLLAWMAGRWSRGRSAHAAPPATAASTTGLQQLGRAAVGAVDGLDDPTGGLGYAARVAPA
jgi:hypothetical protein